MVAYIYQKLVEEGIRAGQVPAKTKTARNWFRSLAEQTSSSPNQIINTAPKVQLTRSPEIGFMYHFFYDPKLKEELPYYDRFPLVLPIEQYSDGFLGINFHYLSMPIRIRLLDRIMTFANNKSLDETTVINANYSALKRVREIKPCLKRYLSGQVRSNFRKINADEFVVAVLLPVARFKKKGESFVHAKSRGMI